jgi:peptidoglycan/LPS O-acetylase OafA/YrhL
MPYLDKATPLCMKLDQIEGARTLAALWIVVAHSLAVTAPNDDLRGGPPPESPFNPALGRARVAVCFFVVLSGFVTHWVYGRPQRWDGDLMKFYANRLDRVVLTATLTMLAAAALGKITGVTGEGVHLNGDPADLTAPRLVACLTYVHWYVDAANDEYTCPNSPVWTVGALIPSWLLYPLYRRLLVAAAERGQRATTAALLLLAAGWAVTFGVIFAICAAEGFDNTERQCMRKCTSRWGHGHSSLQVARAAGCAVGMLVLKLSSLETQDRVVVLLPACAAGRFHAGRGHRCARAACRRRRACAWRGRTAPGNHQGRRCVGRGEGWRVGGTLGARIVGGVACGRRRADGSVPYSAAADGGPRKLNRVGTLAATCARTVVRTLVRRALCCAGTPCCTCTPHASSYARLLATTVGSPAAPGGVARVLRHPALASMGKYSFHVYLLHTLVVLVVTAAGLDVTAAPNIVALLLVTSLLAGLCAPRLSRTAL